MSNAFSTTLSVLHFTVGACSLIAPSLTCETFGIVPQASTIVVGRLFGSRDLALGLALWMASPINPEARRGALFAANLINAIDIVSCIVCYSQGTLSDKALLLGAGGAAALLGLGLLGLRWVVQGRLHGLEWQSWR